MKPGDMVKAKFANTGLEGTGIIICESPRSNSWGHVYYTWWRVLSDRGHIIDELADNMEVVSETR